MVMIIGASSFAGSLPELKQEVDSIELYIPKLGVYEGTRLMKRRIAQIRDTISPYGISTSVHAPYFSDAPNYPRELAVDTARLDETQARLLTDSIRIAEALESNVVVIHPGRINGNRERSLSAMVDGLTRLTTFAEERNVVLGLENKEGTDQKNLCTSACELIDTIQNVDSPNLRATFDIGHANLTCGGDASKLREFARKLKGYIVHVHVHDNSGQLTDNYWGDFHGAPGTGVVDFSVLKELDFHGVYNLEVFSLEEVRIGKQMLLNMQGL